MAKRWGKSIILSLLVLSTLSLSSCWDAKDVRNRAFITAIGLDSGTESIYKVTLELVRPLGLKPHSPEPASIVFTVEADSIDAAIELIQARISRPITLAHLRLVLVGEEKARKDFRDIEDYFKRHPEVQMRIRLMFVKDGEAKDLLMIEPIMEKYPSAELVAMVQLAQTFSLVTTQPFFIFTSALGKRDGRAFSTRVLSSEEGNVGIKHGGAVFNNWRLVGWLSCAETQNANWIIGEGNVVVEGKSGESTYTYNVDKRSVQIIPIVEPIGDIRFTVKVKTDGYISQQQGNRLDLSKPDNIEKLEALFSREITRQVESAIFKAQQEFGVDYLGFDMALNNRHPRVYQQVDWNERFPNIPIHVEVDARISRIGIAP